MAHRFFLFSTIKSPFWTNAFFKRADVINLCFSLPNGKNIQSQHLVCFFLYTIKFPFWEKSAIMNLTEEENVRVLNKITLFPVFFYLYIVHYESLIQHR